MSGKVQHASTHQLERQNHEHAHNSRSVQEPVQGGEEGPGRFRKQAHKMCLVLVHIRLVQRRFASKSNVDATTLPSVSTRNVPSGQWMKIQGNFKMQAHITSGVVMDVAAFKVSHSVDIDAAALRAARARSKSIGPMDEMSQKSSKCKHSPTGTQTPRARAQQLVSSRVSSRGQWMKCHGRFKVQTPTPCCAHARQHSVNSVGR